MTLEIRPNTRYSSKPMFDGKKSRLNLVVQSAYVRDWKHSNRPHTKLIRFEVILYNVMNGREIKTP